MQHSTQYQLRRYFSLDDMKDFPLRAWVLNGSQEYKIKQTKVHGDVRGVNVTLQGENKVHLLFTVLSTDQRSNYNLTIN